MVTFTLDEAKQILKEIVDIKESTLSNLTYKYNGSSQELAHQGALIAISNLKAYIKERIVEPSPPVQDPREIELQRKKKAAEEFHEGVVNGETTRVSKQLMESFVWEGAYCGAASFVNKKLLSFHLKNKNNSIEVREIEFLKFINPLIDNILSETGLAKKPLPELLELA